MYLAIRMVLYFLSAAFASQGLAVYDEAAGTITFQIDNLAQVLAGVATYLATFISSRFAANR